MKSSYGYAPGINFVLPVFVSNRMLPGVPLTPKLAAISASLLTLSAYFPLSRQLVNLDSFTPASFDKLDRSESAIPVPPELVFTNNAFTNFQNAVFPPSSFAHSEASASLAAFAWKGSGRGRETQATSPF